METELRNLPLNLKGKITKNYAGPQDELNKKKINHLILIMDGTSWLTEDYS